MADVMVRRLIRQAVVSAVSGLAGGNVMSPGDWDVPAKSLPAIKVRSGQEHKQSVVVGMPQFTTVLSVEVQIAVEAATDVAAQDDLEALGQQVEAAILCNYELIRLIQRVSGVTTVPTFAADGERHLAGLQMVFEFEVFEAFDPTLYQTPPDLEGVDVTLDAIAPFDPSGTYPNPAFPDSVVPAPRIQGPDGRAEGVLHINLNT